MYIATAKSETLAERSVCYNDVKLNHCFCKWSLVASVLESSMMNVSSWGVGVFQCTHWFRLEVSVL